MGRFLWALIGFLGISTWSWGAEWTPFSRGPEVVEAALGCVQAQWATTELADISTFLRRIARAESACGMRTETYRPGYYGGIWQVDRVAFEETQRISAHPRLARWQQALRRQSQEKGLPVLDWNMVQWEQLTAPAYSCLAARFYLACIPEAVPEGLVEQAVYWKKYYNTEAGAGTIRGFLRANQGYPDSRREARS